jgi:hypothetical protein
MDLFGFTYALASALFLVYMFLLLVIETLSGGSPELGKIEGNHYFLAEHGRFTEVTSSLYFGLSNALRFERYAGLLLVGLLPILLLVISLKKRTRQRSSDLGKLTPTTTSHPRQDE